MSADVLESLTPAEQKRLRDQMAPIGREIMVAWGRHVLAASPVERRMLVASKIEVLATIHEDPAGWCSRALELAREAGDQHAD